MSYEGLNVQKIALKFVKFKINFYLDLVEKIILFILIHYNFVHYSATIGLSF